jgi:hypothetical protein
MGYQTLDPTDLVLSADSTVTPLWSDYKTTLTTFFTSSAQTASNSGDYYYTIYDKDVNDTNITNEQIQFYLSYGDIIGGGSELYNILVSENSPTRTIYGQYRSLLYGDENANFIFGGIYSSPNFYVINIERSRYKEKLLPSSFELTLDSTGIPNTYGGGILTLIANVSSTPTFTDAGRVYEIVSGSLADGIYKGKNNFGYSADSGSYGLLYPDVGIVVLNPGALSNPMVDGDSIFRGGIELSPVRTENINFQNSKNLYNVIEAGGSFKLQSEETLSSNYVFIRARNGDFNYSSNPSYISGSTGELVNEILINQPITYITTVGLYNDNNDLLAVAKLSRPLQKDFTKELLVRVKLDF